MSILKKVKNKIIRKVDLDNLDEKSFILVANEFIKALGGAENIKKIYSCSTRLRVNLEKNSIDEKKLIENGVKGLIKLDDLNYQIILGKNAMKLEEIINKYLGGR